MRASRSIKVSNRIRLRRGLTAGLGLAFFCSVLGLTYYGFQAEEAHQALRARDRELADSPAEQEAVKIVGGSARAATGKGASISKAETTNEAGLTPERRRLRRIRRTIRDIHANRLAQGGGEKSSEKSQGKPPPPSGPRGNLYFPELLNDPEYAELVKAQLQPRLEREWRPFLQRYQLDNAKRTALLSILAEEQLTLADLSQFAGNRNSGSGMAEEMVARNEWRKERDAQLRDLFGPDGDKQVNDYRLTQLYRGNFLDAFKVRLSYGPHPLEPLQEEHLSAVLGQWQADPDFKKRHEASSQIPSEGFIAAASSILDVDQRDALRELRDERTSIEPPSNVDAAFRAAALNRARAEAESRARVQAEMEANAGSKKVGR